MITLHYILLGVLQGVFEWIPISSEGVVALASKFLLTDINAVNLALFLHLGTLLAALIYFRKDWKRIITFKDKELLRFLLITTIISLIVSFPLYLFVKNMALGSGLLLITGVGLLFTAFFQKKKFQLKTNNSALLVGILQGFSVIPGLSRSGATIFGLSLSKKDPEEILKISYLMSVPVGICSSAYLFLTEPELVFSGWIALISSFVVGLLFLYLLFAVIKRINFFKFALFFSIICLIGGVIGFLI